MSEASKKLQKALHRVAPGLLEALREMLRYESQAGAPGNPYTYPLKATDQRRLEKAGLVIRVGKKIRLTRWGREVAA